MLVFIDDSGDAGFKLGKGSSEFFVISAVIFDDNLEVEKTAVAIKQFRRELGFSDRVEFKFNGSRREIRKKFLDTVNKFDFRIRSLVIDKKIIRSAELKNNKYSFYGYAIKTLLKYSNNSILEASIKIDGSGDRAFRKTFLTYLRKELNSAHVKIVKNCKLVDSRSNMLVQLADMVAGSVRRSYDESKKDHQEYKNIIKKHIEDEWKFR